MSDNRKDLPPVTAPNFLEKVREALSTYMGNRGDKFDRGLTLRDWANGSLRYPPTGRETDLTTPPVPTSFLASTQRGSVLVQTDEPVFLTGNGYARTVVYGAKYLAGDPTPVFSAAAVLTNFVGKTCTFAADPASLYRLWVSWISMDGVESPPAGGTNGVGVTVAALDGDNIASLPASKLITGALLATTFVQSTGYAATTSGWKYGGDGTAEFNGLVASGTTLEGVAATGATGTGHLVFSGSPTLTTPSLGTPTALVGTNMTGTATGFTAGDAQNLGGVAASGYSLISHTHASATAAVIVTKFSTPGTATWTPAADTKIIIVEVQAGGGGSAAIVTSGHTCGSAGGGGYSRLVMVNPGAQTVVVGAGGLAKSAGVTSAGNTGGTSSFGAYLSATGGSGGTAASAGSSSKFGGTGGAASGGDINIYGYDGGPMVAATAQGASGAFGGGSHTSKASYAPLNAGQTSPAYPGSGACGRFTTIGAGTAGGDGWVIVTELSNI